MGDIKTELLIKQCINGSTEAFNELMAIYQNKVYAMCLHLTGNQEDAMDLAQEALIRAYHALPGFKGNAAFTTWLYRIIYNLWVNELRKRQKHKTVSLDAPVQSVEDDFYRELAVSSDNPEDSIEAAEDRKLIWDAVNTLNHEQKATLVMREMYGYSYEEIAGALGCSEGTVKSRLNRARSHLKDRLAKYFGR